jgi:hypothetical protein
MDKTYNFLGKTNCGFAKSTFEFIHITLCGHFLKGLLIISILLVVSAFLFIGIIPVIIIVRRG